MGNEWGNGVHLHSEIFQLLKNKIIKFTGKLNGWLQGKVILSEITQVQKDKYSMYSLTCGC